MPKHMITVSFHAGANVGVCICWHCHLLSRTVVMMPVLSVCVVFLSVCVCVCVCVCMFVCV